MHSQGATAAQVASAYGVTEPSIRGLVMRRGVHRKIVHTLRHDAFDTLTPEGLYWIGFIFADGSISMRQGYLPTLSVNLAERDREHLVALREFLGSPARFPVLVRNGGRICSPYVLSASPLGSLSLAVTRVRSTVAWWSPVTSGAAWWMATDRSAFTRQTPAGARSSGNGRSSSSGSSVSPACSRSS